MKNDETRDVRHDRTTTIKNHDTRTVSEGNDEHTVKKGNQTVDRRQQGDQTIEVATRQADRDGARRPDHHGEEGQPVRDDRHRATTRSP